MMATSVPVLTAPPAEAAPAVAPRVTELFIDLTSTTHSLRRSAGTTRVEWQFARHVSIGSDALVRFVSWSSRDEAFLLLSAESLMEVRDECVDLPGSPRGERLNPAALAPPADGRRLLLVAGAGWLPNSRYLSELLDLRRQLKAELHAMIFDVIHLRQPHWFPEAEAARLGSNLHAMLTSADRVMVSARAIAADVEEVTALRHVEHAPVRRVAFGDDLPEAGAPGPLDALPFGPEIARRGYVLFVSTITYRKNHDFIYQVWRRLAAELGDSLPILLFVGRVAPDQKMTIDRITRDAAMARHIKVLSDVTDEQLATLYANCAFTVFPSLYEGWGIPVAESLQYGKLCIASNAGALPEASGGVTPLLDPHDHGAWCDEIRRLVLDPDAIANAEARVRSRYRPTSWAEAGAQLRALLAEPVTPRPAIRRAANAGPRDVAWRIAAREGCAPGGDGVSLRISGTRASVSLLLDEMPRHGVRVWMTLRSLTSAPTHVDITVSGVPTDAWPLVPGAEMAPRAVIVSTETMRQRGLLDLDLRVAPDSVRNAAASLAGAPTLELRDLRVERLDADEAAAFAQGQAARWTTGDVMAFDAGGRGGTLLQEGWGAPAHWGVWSVAEEASLAFRPVPRGQRALFLRALVRAFVWPQAPTLDVDVLVDGTRVATWQFDHLRDRGRTERTLLVPASVGNADLMRITFRMPGCRSPREIGLGADDRRLGLALMKAQWLLERPTAADADWLLSGR